MVFISVTRLRIRSLRFLPGFFLQTLQAQRQVETAEGFRGGSLLADRRWTFWTMTAWDSIEAMRGYMTAGAHRTAMPRLLDWCDEASVAHWEQPEDDLPSWLDAAGRMRSEGRPSKVRHPSPNHAGMTFEVPRLTGSGPIRPRRPA